MHLLCVQSRRNWCDQVERYCSAHAALLVQDLLIASRDLKLSRYLKRLSGIPPPVVLLIIDDLGYVQAEPGGNGGLVHVVG